MDSKTQDYYYHHWILCQRLLQHTSRCVGYYAERKIALFLRGIPGSFCHYQIQLSEEEQNHIRHCPISSIDSCNDKELCEKLFLKIAALRTVKKLQIKRFGCLEEDVISPEWKVARLFMPIRNRKSTGPENADIASLCHLLLCCDLYLDSIRKRQSIEKIRDIGNQLVRRADRTASREDVETLFANTNSLFNDMLQDRDIDKELKTKMRKDNEVLKEVYENLQEKDTILFRFEELKFRKEPNYIERLLEMDDDDDNSQGKLGKTECINWNTVKIGTDELKHQPEIMNHELEHNESIIQHEHDHSAVKAATKSDLDLPQKPVGTSIVQQMQSQTTDRKSNTDDISTSKVYIEKKLGKCNSVVSRIHISNTFNQEQCESNSKPGAYQSDLSGLNNSSRTIQQFNQQAVPSTEQNNSATNANNNSNLRPDISSENIKNRDITTETANMSISSTELNYGNYIKLRQDESVKQERESSDKFKTALCVQTDPITQNTKHVISKQQSGMIFENHNDQHIKQSGILKTNYSPTNANRTLRLNKSIPNTENQWEVLIEIPHRLIQYGEEIIRIILVDLDNWSRFFHKLPGNLPSGIFVWGFYGSKWRPRGICKIASYNDIVGRKMSNFRSCGNTKDAADACIIMAVAELNSQFRKEIPFEILSGDKIFQIFNTLQSCMKRQINVVDPHMEITKDRKEANVRIFEQIIGLKK